MLRAKKSLGVIGVGGKFMLDTKGLLTEIEEEVGQKNAEAVDLWTSKRTMEDSPEGPSCVEDCLLE